MPPIPGINIQPTDQPLPDDSLNEPPQPAEMVVRLRTAGNPRPVEEDETRFERITRLLGELACLFECRPEQFAGMATIEISRRIKETWYIQHRIPVLLETVPSNSIPFINDLEPDARGDTWYAVHYPASRVKRKTVTRQR